MTLNDFISQLNDAKTNKQTAMEKVKAALEELNAAEAQMDGVLSLLTGPDFLTIDDSLSFWDGSALSEMFAPARELSKVFHFGDLF